MFEIEKTGYRTKNERVSPKEKARMVSRGSQESSKALQFPGRKNKAPLGDPGDFAYEPDEPGNHEDETLPELDLDGGKKKESS